MADGADSFDAAKLAEERIRLEREALQLERERLAAARAHAAAEAKLAARAPRSWWGCLSVVLLTLLAFAGGLITGVAVMENRQQRQRAARLQKALSQLDDIAGASATNAPPGAAEGGHRNVSVVVIE